MQCRTIDLQPLHTLSGWPARQPTGPHLCDLPACTTIVVLLCHLLAFCHTTTGVLLSAQQLQLTA
ncbi:hypothetical protein [Endozoicomonas lisbonensis]